MEKVKEPKVVVVDASNYSEFFVVFIEGAKTALEAYKALNEANNNSELEDLFDTGASFVATDLGFKMVNAADSSTDNITDVYDIEKLIDDGTCRGLRLMADLGVLDDFAYNSAMEHIEEEELNEEEIEEYIRSRFTYLMLIKAKANFVFDTEGKEPINGKYLYQINGDGDFLEMSYDWQCIDDRFYGKEEQEGFEEFSRKKLEENEVSEVYDGYMFWGHYLEG